MRSAASQSVPVKASGQWWHAAWTRELPRLHGWQVFRSSDLDKLTLRAIRGLLDARNLCLRVRSCLETPFFNLLLYPTNPEDEGNAKRITGDPIYDRIVRLPWAPKTPQVARRLVQLLPSAPENLRGHHYRGSRTCLDVVIPCKIGGSPPPGLLVLIHRISRPSAILATNNLDWSRCRQHPPLLWSRALHPPLTQPRVLKLSEVHPGLTFAPNPDICHKPSPKCHP
ncbi:hypothetical protein R3P38DRAFT_3562048 [Favolaschia claudopus]|uniref:Uncharacterized protein n=1 Tax=Favolaschia claudopus TaxID=2862362 RepID=A0AAW0AV51_9AGAR